MADIQQKDYIKVQREALRRQEEQSKILKDLLSWQKSGEVGLEDEIKKVREEINKLSTFAGNSTKTAEMVSVKLGQDEAFQRELSHQMVEMFNEDKEARIVWQKGNQQEKALMLKQMKEEAIERLNLDERQKMLYMGAIERGWDKLSDNIGDIVEKASNPLQPLIDNMIRSVDDMRHSVVKRFPNALRFLSDEMVEHYKTGAREIGGAFQKDMSTILAPIDALLGPAKAVIKTLFIVGKTLLNHPTKHEKETAKVQREIRDAVKQRNKDARSEATKNWMERQKEKAMALYNKSTDIGQQIWEFFKKYVIPIVALGVGVVVGYFDTAKKAFGSFLSVFSFVGKAFKGWFGEGSAIFKLFSEGGRFAKIGEKFTRAFNWFGKFTPYLERVAPKLFNLGKVFGKLVMPLQMLWNFFKDFGKIKELFAKGDIAGIIKHIAASILDPIFDIPEMIVNGLSWLFGSEFRVDFGKDAIMKWIDDATKWIFDNFTDPVFTWIGEMIDETAAFFGKIGEVFTKIKDGLLGAMGTIWDKATSWIPGFGGEEETTPKKESGGGYKFKYPADWMKGTAPYSQAFDRVLMKEIVLAKETGADTESFYNSLMKDRAEFNKPIPTTPSLQEVPKAKAKAQSEQTAATEALGAKMDATNSNLEKNTEAQNTIINNIVSQPKEKQDNIPTDVHDIGVMMNNAVFGV